jgi:hypothetical protein
MSSSALPNTGVAAAARSRLACVRGKRSSMTGIPASRCLRRCAFLAARICSARVSLEVRGTAAALLAILHVDDAAIVMTGEQFNRASGPLYAFLGPRFDATGPAADASAAARRFVRLGATPNRLRYSSAKVVVLPNPQRLATSATVASPVPSA